MFKLAKYKPKLANFWPIAILLIFNLIFFAKLFFPPSLYTSADFGRGDLTHFHYPLRAFLSESLKSGHLPLWTDKIFGGFPVFSEGQVGTLYIPNLVLFYLLPTWLAFNLGYLVTYFTAGVGLYFYLQFLKLSKVSSLFGAVAFSFSFFFTGHIIHYNLIQTASLLPLMFLVWENFLKKPSLIYFLLFGLLASQAIFTGFQQIFFYSLLAIISLTFFRIWKRGWWKKLFIMISLGTALIYSFLLSAIQILATAELTAKTGRGFGLAVGEIAKFPYHPANILTFFNPFIFGNPSNASYPPYSDSWGIFWENASYIGIVPLILAVISIYFLFSKKDKNFIFFFWLALTTFLLTLGKFGPLFFLETLPPFSLFRVPARFIFLVIFGLCCLAALSFENLKNKIKLPLIFSLVVILISFFDLYFWGVNYNGGVRLEDWLAKPDTAQFLSEVGPGERIYALGQFANWNNIYKSNPPGWSDKAAEKIISARAILDPNANMVWDIPNAYGYAALVPRRIVLIKDLIQGQIKSTDDGKFEIPDNVARLFSTFSVKYVVSTKEIISKSFKKVFESNWGQTGTKYYIYQNLKVLPKVRLADSVKVVSDLDQLTQALLAEDFNPQTTAVLEKNLKIKNFDTKNSAIEAVHWANTKVEIIANLQNSAIIEAAISRFPGWKAYLDGKRVEILAANISQQAVLMPAGTHTLVFSYQPYWLKVGGIISAVSYLLLFSLLGLKLFKRR